MNGTAAEHNKSGEVDGSRFVFEGPVSGRSQQQADQPVQQQSTVHFNPAPQEALLPQASPRPFPISVRDENPKRGNWWNKIEFIFACIAVSVSSSSLLTLPYQMYRSGGGIFFIIFVIFIMFIMFPYMVLEMALGQFSSSGIISLWNFSPLFKGFGVVAALYLALNNVLFNVLSSYHLLYAFFTIKCSVSGEALPWLTCTNAWNTPYCSDGHSVSPVNYSMGSMYSPEHPIHPIDASEEYWKYLIDSQSDLTMIGSLKPTLVFSLLATWGFILVLTCMGAKWTGKVAYFVLPLFIILLFALLIRGATLPGAIDGLIFFLHFDASKLLQYEVWAEAFNAMSYVAIMGFGVFSSLSSYNKFHNNFCLDAFLITMAVIVINLMMVLMVATYTGYLSFSRGVTIGDVVSSGLGLTLQMMPQAMGAVPSANAWACVFFLSVFLLLTSSSIYIVQALLTTLLDVFHLPHSFIFLLPTSGIICVLSFLISLPMVTEAGYQVVVALDQYTLLWAPLVVAIILPLASVWIYGTIPKWNIMRLPKEVEKMVGCFPKPMQLGFLLLWAVVIPACSAVALLLQFIRTLQFGGYIQPYWMGYVLLAVGIVPVVLIPIIVAIFQLCKGKRPNTFFTQMFWNAAQSSPDWGPPVEVHRQQAGYSRLNGVSDSSRPLTSEVHFNPAASSQLSNEGVTTELRVAGPDDPVPKQAEPYSPPPPAYNDYTTQPWQVSPSSSKNLSPAPSSAGSGLPSLYPSPLTGDAGQPPASPATVSATDTLDSNRLYPSAPLDAGAETDLGLSEQEDSLFVNMSSHETTL